MSTQFTTPIESMFDFHRTAIRQQQSLTHDAIEAQRTMLEATGQSLDVWRNLIIQNREFSSELANASIANIESYVPDEFEGLEEAQAVIDQQLELAEETTEETFELSESAFDEAEVAYDEFISAFLEAYDSGIDAYLDATEDLQTTSESVAESIDLDES